MNKYALLNCSKCDIEPKIVTYEMKGQTIYKYHCPRCHTETKPITNVDYVAIEWNKMQIKEAK